MVGSFHTFPLRCTTTADHIRTLIMLMDLIHIGRKQRKPVLVKFLDITKAYEKAWIDTLLYNVCPGETRNKHKHMDYNKKKLDENLTTRIQTKYGSTRNIKIKDSIRQGGVLSILLYALLMDEISKEQRK